MWVHNGTPKGTDPVSLAGGKVSHDGPYWKKVITYGRCSWDMFAPSPPWEVTLSSIICDKFI